VISAVLSRRYAEKITRVSAVIERLANHARRWVADWSLRRQDRFGRLRFEQLRTAIGSNPTIAQNPDVSIVVCRHVTPPADGAVY
jgi:hypothetical protein